MGFNSGFKGLKKWTNLAFYSSFTLDPAGTFETYRGLHNEFVSHLNLFLIPDFATLPCKQVCMKSTFDNFS